MKNLNFEQMEVLNGGNAACVLAIASLGLSTTGMLVSMATLNPFGTALGYFSVHVSIASVGLSCDMQL